MTCGCSLRAYVRVVDACAALDLRGFGRPLGRDEVSDNDVRRADIPQWAAPRRNGGAVLDKVQNPDRGGDKACTCSIHPDERTRLDTGRLGALRSRDGDGKERTSCGQQPVSVKPWLALGKFGLRHDRQFIAETCPGAQAKKSAL